MEFLKSVFGDKALTYAELETALKNNKEIKLANLATGGYIDKEKFDKAELKSVELQGMLETANTTIKGFKDMDVETIKKSADDWKQKYEKETGELTQKLQQQTINSKLEIGLLGAKAKNTTAVKALLKIEDIKLDGDKLLGFSDQLEKITKENPYLFGEADKNPTPGAGQPTQADELSTWRAEAGLPAVK